MANKIMYLAYSMDILAGYIHRRPHKYPRIFLLNELSYTFECTFRGNGASDITSRVSNPSADRKAKKS